MYSRYNKENTKLTTIKNDSTKHMTVYSSVLALTNFRHH